MSVKINLFSIVPGAIIEVPGGAQGSTRALVAKQVYRDHNSESVCVIPHDDREEAHIGDFNDRVTLIGLDANTGGMDEDASDIDGGDLEYIPDDGVDDMSTVFAHRADTLDQVAGLLGEINHTLRESAHADTIDIIEDASRSIMLAIGLSADETPDDITVHNLLDIIGQVNSTALADIQAACQRAYQHGPHMRLRQDTPVREAEPDLAERLYDVLKDVPGVVVADGREQPGMVTLGDFLARKGTRRRF